MTLNLRIVFLIVSVCIFACTTGAAGKKKSLKSSGQNVDPIVGGKPYGAGAVFNITQKGVDFISWHLNNLLTGAIRSMTVPNFTATIDGGQLQLDALRVGDYSATPFKYDFPSRNRFVYWTENNRLNVWGAYRFTPAAGTKSTKTGKAGKAITPATETGRVTLSSMEADMNVTTEFRRAADGKPTLEFVECIANFDRWTVEYVPSKPQFVNVTSDKLRKHLEDTTCKLLRDYFTEVIGVAMSSFSNRIPLTGDKKFVLDYDLLNNQPELVNKSIKADLKGQVLWQNYYAAPFWPAFETSANTEDQQTTYDRMATFRLGDYVFNTLFHHAYWQNQLRMSAYDTIPETSSLRDRLRLRCPTAPANQRPSCFGDVFGNATDNFPPTAVGDLVFKPDRRPPTILIRSMANGSSTFDAYGGYLEAYAVLSHDGSKRQLLARSNVVIINGDFTPTLTSKINITGNIRLTEFQLSADLTRVAHQMKDIDATPTWVEQLARLASPLVEYMFNAFLERMQFPVYMPTHVECVPPANFRLTERTMNVECDLRPLIGQPMFMTLEKARSLAAKKVKV